MRKFVEPDVADNPLLGDTLKEGVFSLWNGHSPM
jgi:hypothetical protein